MSGDTAEAMTGRSRLARRALGKRWLGLLPSTLAPRAIWISAAAALAMAGWTGWMFWSAHVLGIDLATSIAQGCGFAVVPLVALGAWAFLVAAKAPPDQATILSPDGFGPVGFQPRRQPRATFGVAGVSWLVRVR